MTQNKLIPFLNQDTDINTKPMKLLITIVCLLILNVSAKSQDTVKIPFPVAKQIAKDLVSYDSTKAELSLAKQKINLLDLKIESLNTSLIAYSKKEIGYLNQMNAYEAKIGLMQTEFKSMLKDYRKEKVKNTKIKIISGLVIGTLSAIILTK